jgi:hypothetical protein
MTIRSAACRVLLSLVLLVPSVSSSVAAAQADPAETQPAFSLSSSQVASTRERPTIELMFRRVRSLDFRVYRVEDPLKFFAGLRDPHTLGSETPVVPQERTWLERIAGWKAGWREAVVTFVRGQFSYGYRRARREAQARRQIALRQVLDARQFAQVPLLNQSQVVATWREILPMVRDTEARRIPLDLPHEGVYVVEAISPPFRAFTVVIVSDLGLVTKSSPGQLVMFAANRFSGAVAAGCQAEVLANHAVVATGTFAADGTFEAQVPEPKPDDIVAVARCGQEVAATDPGGWYFQDKARDLVAYVYTDKPVYRPGHTVNLKAVLRWRVGDALLRFDRKQVEVSISDPNDKVVFRQPATVDEFGTVLATYPVSRGAALGYYSVQVASQDDSATGSFEVQEYRKPEFEVIVRPAARFALQGTQTGATVSARYYFGQPVANGVVKYSVHKEGYYSPFRWSDDAGDEPDQGGGWYGGEEKVEGTLRLNDQGTAELAVPLAMGEDDRDYSVRIEARVTDASSREVSGDTVIHATYGRFMLVARSDNYAYAPGSQATLSVKAIDYVGAEQPGVKVSVSLDRVTYSQDRPGTPSADRVTEGVVTTDATGLATWTVTLPKTPGDYRLSAAAQSEGRTVVDSAYAWVRGRAEAEESGEDLGDRELELVPDKKSYAPGDVAHLGLKGNVVPTATLVTKEGRQVSWKQVVRPAGASTIDVPILEGDLGDVYVDIAFLKDDRLYRAEKRLKVPATARQLTLTVVADQAVSRPGQPAAFTIKVEDVSGHPVRAQVSLGVIDEAVYGVRPDETEDPLRFFYRREYSRVGTEFSREYSFTGFSGTQQLMLAQRRRPGGLADFKGDRPTQPQVRKDFPDAIYWAGAVVTGADGTARVQFSYPDSLTTWRLTARAVTIDTEVGAAIARTTVTKDLIVRVVTPRFLTEGDEVVIPTIVHNYLASAKMVTVTMKAEGVTTVAGQPSPQPQTVEVAQAGEHRDDWRFLANRVATATFTANAVTDVDADAVELSIPVQPFGLKRQVGAAGSIAGDGERSAQLTLPASANPASRTIRVSLAPSLAGPLLGALDFLTSYPYGCTEQTLSGFLPDVLVLRALDQLKIAPAERLQSLDRQVSEGLQRLYDYQHDDGGWGWWKTDENHPFMTAYALYGLVEARRAGYKVDASRIENGAAALKKLFATYPRAVPDLKAYMTYVLTQVESAPAGPGGADSSALTPAQAIAETWPTRDRMSPYGQALLLLALDAVKDRRAEDLVQTLVASAQRKGDLAWWQVDSDPLLEDGDDTSVEATAFVVKALTARVPTHPLLEPAVRWLLLNRNYGMWWSSTKQTAMALYGLLDYMRARKEGTSTATVEVLVNGTSVGTRNFTPASLTAPDPEVLTAPASGGTNTVTIRQKGGGTVYWSATAEYFDTAGPLARTGSHRLALVRKYYALTPVRQGDRIVYRETPFDGRATPGDLLLVRLDAAGSTDWRYLMIEDPLPAGVEAVQQVGLYAFERRQEFWDGSRREYHDDRIVFFQESFTAGHYQYVYLLKVTTPGVFRAMPAQISAMYVPGATASSEPQTLTVGSDAPRPAGPTK